MTVSLVDARERHAAARKLLASGVDPMEKRKAEKTAGASADGVRIPSKLISFSAP
jgi:hypothetical protein